jgi:uncharacterized damage-inducible protein DinB
MTDTAAAPSLATLKSLFAFKQWSNEELFRTLATVDGVAHGEAVHGALRILNHIYVVDRIFRGHLEGKPHGFSATNTERTPSVAELADSVRECDGWYLDYVGALAPEQLGEQVKFTFTDGDAGRMSRMEILMHIVTHGGYHRGAAGQIMRGAGTPPPRDLFTRFLHAREPERRG